MPSMTSPVPRQEERGEVVRTPRGRGREIVGRFLVWTSGIHVGIAAAGPSIYRHFADAAVMGWVERGWNGVFMANPRAWGLAVAAGELTLALLLLHGGRAATVGWLGVIGFHVALVLFGWGYLIWSAPALAVLVPLVWREWPQLSAREAVSVEPAS